MIERKQLFRNDPKNGVHGDCHRTAIACLLNLEPEDVPHFAAISMEDESIDWDAAVKDFLAGQGLAQVDVFYHGDSPLEDVLSAVGARNKGVYYLLGGMSPRGTNHTVVGCGGRIAWDPHPDGGDLVGPLSHGFWEVTYLVPISMLEKPRIADALIAELDRKGEEG